MHYPDTWPMVYSDKSMLPNIFWAYGENRKFMDKKFGSVDGVDAFQRAQQVVSKFNFDCQTQTGFTDITYAKIEQTTAGETVVAILDPFMRRVHKVIPQSGEICMVDATSNLGTGLI